MDSAMKVLVAFSIIFGFYFENVESVVVQHYDCWKPRDGRTCTIHNLSIDPCPSSKKEKSLTNPCEILRDNSTAVLKFDYTADFNITSPLAQASKSTLLQDIPFVDMDTDACKFTKCPVQSGVQNTYTFPLEVKPEYPEGAYTVKWKIWNLNEPIKESCCLKFKIILI